MVTYLSESLTSGLICPSSLPIGTEFFFVKKKDSSPRPCIDYRGLYEITARNKYPLPLLEAAYVLLQRAHLFTELDLRNTYHPVRIRSGDKWKMTFKTPLGHFKYRGTPFGLTNATMVFHALVKDVLRDRLNKFLFVHMGNILIFSETEG